MVKGHDLLSEKPDEPMCDSGGTHASTSMTLPLDAPPILECVTPLTLASTSFYCLSLDSPSLSP